MVGIAVGAGLLMRSHRAPASTDDASAPTAASVPFNALPSSPSSQALAEAPAPALAASASDVAATPTQPPTASETTAASANAPVTQATSQPDTAASAPAPAQPQPQPQAQPTPQATSPMPAQTDAKEPTSPAPRQHEKPKKSTASADRDAGENATIRAAIAGSLLDGASCFGNKKFDCAISNADAVLRLDPRNAQALSLRKRAKIAQQSALNSMSIE
ncbi:hypothetical protein [Paraburkholderia sp. Cpub6]|uniref:hypothetical protein n=1 Tax=Paraburkholderia sp. Cpub6 TaxID=2723094 RepID=UPI001845FF10|nr:hypothetical protein [Paraburkholderia sp. Cpub6]MBB5463074.1 outer membrane biosynthesis protein TonB [Paraburkholderia sp. Cpub6]